MPIHDFNCTRCVHRRTFKGAKKGDPETEQCGLTAQVIPAPFKPGRFCMNFQQIGHDCESCTDKLTNNIY